MGRLFITNSLILKTLAFLMTNLLFIASYSLSKNSGEGDKNLVLWENKIIG